MEYSPRELIIILGHAGSGKSAAILQVAEEIQSTMYIIDTENGILKMWKNQYPSLKNIKLYLVTSMDDVLTALAEITQQIQANDWIAIESMSRIWELAQDTAYEEITGMAKSEYLQSRTSKSPIPSPDEFWQIVSSLYSRGLIGKIVKLDPILAEISKEKGCNVLTTTLIKKEGVEKLISARRKYAQEIGVTVLHEGSPRLLSYFDTVIHTKYENGEFSAQILKDRGYQTPGRVVSFRVENFWRDFCVNRKTKPFEKEYMFKVALSDDKTERVFISAASEEDAIEIVKTRNYKLWEIIKI